MNILQKAKRDILFFTRRNLTRRPWVRRQLTANYSTGKLAFGEQNKYGFSYFWVTVDVADADFNVDLRQHRPLPFADNSQAVIYSAHMVEHLDPATLAHFLSEAYRILRKGGAIRLETPDAERAVDAYRKKDRTFLDYFARDNAINLVQNRGFSHDYTKDPICFLGILSCYIEGDAQIPVYATAADVDRRLTALSLDAFGEWAVSLQTPAQRKSGGHVNIMYFEKLKDAINTAGFKIVRKSQNGKTAIPGLDLRGVERSDRAFYSLYVEAEK
jgi:SAM-dependent methyltransferase